MQLGWRVGSSKISTNTRTLINSVYHGRYFDSIYSCEVRGHSPVTEKQGTPRGGGVFVCFCFCRLFSWLLFVLKPLCSSTFPNCPHKLITTRFIGRYHGTRQLVTSHTRDSLRHENTFLISTPSLSQFSWGVLGSRCDSPHPPMSMSQGPMSRPVMRCFLATRLGASVLNSSL